MSKEELKKRALETLENHKDHIFNIQETIKQHPEYGYKEVFATDLLYKELSSLGLKVDKNIAITGCRAYANEEKKGIKVAIMGEMDAVTCFAHPFADEKTGASHSCGHSIQSSVMLGAAIALIKSGVFKDLDGQIDFFAIPAEEYLELDYRSQLREQKKIKYYGGKQELISRGAFDDVDMVLMMHSHHLNGKKLQVNASTNGFIGKQVFYYGKAAHAGGSPHLGVNALNAISLGLQAANANRETFIDDQHIRFHPIVTQGGSGVNTVPDQTSLESYIRGVSIESILDANKKINRALVSGALAVGASIEIQDTPGYFPYQGNDTLARIFEQNALQFLDSEDIVAPSHYAFSLDVGDLAHILPTLHPFVGGVEGELHAKEFKIINPEVAIINPIKAIVCSVIDLLYNKAEQAKQVKSEFRPLLTKEQYLNQLDEFFSTTKMDPQQLLNL